VAARIGLEKRIFEFKTYTPFLINEQEKQISDADIEENPSS
jgi:hypothetical protein